MELSEAILRRRTTNGPFLPDPVRLEHQHRLMHAASRAPSHFNSQPWRFCLVTDPKVRAEIGEIAGATMERLIAEGTFFRRYRKYFRFSRGEMDARRDGIFVDKLPAPLRPFAGYALSPFGVSIMNRLGVPRILGRDNARLVAESPLLLAACLTREEYREGELSAFYSVFGLSAAMENVWLTTVELGMGIQFVSTPLEVPEARARIERLLEVPDDLVLMALFRLGYLPPDRPRPRIDWSSRHRKRMSQFVFRDTFRTPEPDGADEEPSP